MIPRIERVRTAGIRAGIVIMVAAGCQTWRSRPVTTAAPVHVTDALRVTTKGGGRRLTLKDVTVRPDSVVGVLVEAADRPLPTKTRAVVEGDDWVVDKSMVPGQRVAVAASNVSSLEERSTSTTRTIVLFGIVVALVLAAQYAYLAISLRND